MKSERELYMLSSKHVGTVRCFGKNQGQLVSLEHVTARLMETDSGWLEIHLEGKHPVIVLARGLVPEHLHTVLSHQKQIPDQRLKVQLAQDHRL